MLSVQLSADLLEFLKWCLSVFLFVRDGDVSALPVKAGCIKSEFGYLLFPEDVKLYSLNFRCNEDWPHLQHRQTRGKESCSHRSETESFYLKCHSHQLCLTWNSLVSLTALKTALSHERGFVMNVLEDHGNVSPALWGPHRWETMEI